MKVLAVFCVLIMLNVQGNAQYYYLDVLGTQQTNNQYKKIRQNNLQKISATSFEGNDRPSTDFVLEQTISAEANAIITRSASINSAESFFKSYFRGNRLVKTVDSSLNALNTVTYQYDTQGKLLATVANNKDFDGTFDQVEEHLWQYDTKGQPLRMIKIKNQVDTTLINFVTDDNGNVLEEHWMKDGRTLETYYYYYNANNKLTDIVRFNRKAKQMLPDFMFEYDNAGLLSQMTQTQGGSANYLTWRYFYKPNGMKEKEYVFNKQKELLGKIEYSYQ